MIKRGGKGVPIAPLGEGSGVETERYYPGNKVKLKKGMIKKREGRRLKKENQKNPQLSVRNQMGTTEKKGDLEDERGRSQQTENEQKSKTNLGGQGPLGGKNVTCRAVIGFPLRRLV